MSEFKRCTCCRAHWTSREEFLADNTIELVGYQVSFKDLELGLILFNHSLCRSTIAITAKHFIDLYEGPVFSERQTASDACPGYCLDKCELRPCAAACECAFVRELLQVLRRWPKQASTVLQPLAPPAAADPPM